MAKYIEKEDITYFLYEGKPVVAKGKPVIVEGKSIGTPNVVQITRYNLERKLPYDIVTMIKTFKEITGSEELLREALDA